MTESEIRLTRQGLVAWSGEGCATIEVGVPCGSCRQAGCLQRRDTGRFTVEGAQFPVGEAVSITLARRDLTTVCMKLFGPGLAWMLALAVAGSTDVWLSLSLGMGECLCLGLTGLGLALYMGRRLVRSDAIMPEIRLLNGQSDTAGKKTQITVQESG